LIGPLFLFLVNWLVRITYLRLHNLIDGAFAVATHVGLEQCKTFEPILRCAVSATEAFASRALQILYRLAHKNSCVLCVLPFFVSGHLSSQNSFLFNLMYVMLQN
jgi:hypothetical protein